MFKICSFVLSKACFQSLAVPTITPVLFLLMVERCASETANVPATDTSRQGNFRTHSTEQVFNIYGSSNTRVPANVGMFGSGQVCLYLGLVKTQQTSLLNLSSASMVS